MSDVLTSICDWAQELGATHARVIADQSYLQAHEYVREACLQNACGKSGRCWTCPPHLGELSELEARLNCFSGAVLVQTIAPLEDSWDFEGMAAAAHAHNDRMRELGHKLAEGSPDCAMLVLGCGGCGFCETCTCPDEPCRCPDEALGSVEGYGVDVKALVESVGLQYINGARTVSYVGAVMVCCEE